MQRDNRKNKAEQFNRSVRDFFTIRTIGGIVLYLVHTNRWLRGAPRRGHVTAWRRRGAHNRARARNRAVDDGSPQKKTSPRMIPIMPSTYYASHPPPYDSVTAQSPRPHVNPRLRNRPTKSAASPLGIMPRRGSQSRWGPRAIAGSEGKYVIVRIYPCTRCILKQQHGAPMSGVNATSIASADRRNDSRTRCETSFRRPATKHCDLA